jgi:hypothetical protein
MRKFRTEFVQYTSDSTIFSDCNSLAFINNGTIAVTIDKFSLPSGASLSIDGNENEMNTTQYRITFNGASNGLITVIRKYYI